MLCMESARCATNNMHATEVTTPRGAQCTSKALHCLTCRCRPCWHVGLARHMTGIQKGVCIARCLTPRLSQDTLIKVDVGDVGELALAAVTQRLQTLAKALQLGYECQSGDLDTGYNDLQVCFDQRELDVTNSYLPSPAKRRPSHAPSGAL
jgi:hypothetical protein